MSEGSVGSHWVHQRFTQNLINASRSRDLGEAAKEWGIYSLHESEGSQHCHLCNTQIKTCVTIRNKENGSYIVLGDDCYDKLLQFLNIGRVETALPERKGYVKDLRSHWKARVREVKVKDRTVTGWLRDELAGGRLSGKVAGIVYTISRLGFAPTKGDADEVIRYYKSARRFSLQSLLKPVELGGFRHTSLLPPEITIDQVDRVRELIQKDRPLSEKLRKLATIKRLQAGFTEVLAELAEFRKRMEIAANKGVESARLGLEKIDEYFRRIESLQPSDTNVLDQFWEISRKVAELSKECRHRYVWNLADPETILSVRTKFSKNYVLVERGGRWQPLWNIDRFVVEGLVSKPGLYTARVVEDSERTLIRLESEFPCDDRLVVVDFNIVSRQDPEAFVGSFRGKVVLPSKSIRKAGEHLVFLTNEEGRYYRAWVL